MQRVALVAGASGLIGRRIAAHLASGGWDVTGLSRTAPAAPGVKHIAVDLTDAAQARRKLAGASGTTHVFYAARHDHPEGTSESDSDNTAMLRNLLDALAPIAPCLEHVNLVHGTKYYGHPAPVPVPVTEDTPRGAGATFYFAQEDLLRERSNAGGWNWSTARPHVFCEPSADEPRSIALVIGVLAAVQRELGAPLFFPGSAKAFTARTQFTDLSLLARALEWMSTEPRCANQSFNVVNGDTPRWEELWPQIAGMLDATAGEPVAFSLAQYMADKSAVWDAIIARHGLRRSALGRIALWEYGDYVFRPEWDIISAMDKARRFGFQERVDSREMFARAFGRLREQRVIP